MATPTVENYVKQIYALQQQAPADDLVSLGQLAVGMGVVPGTATTMVKSLAESGLVRYELRQGVRLTPAGERLALRVLRRHRLIELFLVRVLSFDWAEVHDEAELLEHALSDRLVDRIDEHLGRPPYDPHGDPIPTANGTIERRTLVSLADADAGQAVTIARIADQDRTFLAYAHDRGLTPGIRVVVDHVDPLGDAVTLSLPDARRVTLGRSAASKVFVELAGDPGADAALPATDVATTATRKARKSPGT